MYRGSEVQGARVWNESQVAAKSFLTTGLSSARLSEADLVQWGERIGRGAQAPLVIALRGDLGAGKSTLARAIARGAGVAGPIPSPTYNLLFRYAADGVHVVHLDLFRLEDPSEVWELGWSEFPAEDEIVLIEWPERAAALLPAPRWEIELHEVEDPSVRKISMTRVGEPNPIPPPEVER